MPILETVAAVAGAIQAFDASATLFRSWREKRRERREAAQNQNLERSLTTGQTTVQSEYDGNFAKLGPRFAVGDDRARAEIAEYVVKLQHAYMTMMTESNSPSTLVLPSLPVIYSTSEDTRNGIVSSLGQLYQRLAQAGPLSGSYVFAAPPWSGISTNPTPFSFGQQQPSPATYAQTQLYLSPSPAHAQQAVVFLQSNLQQQPTCPFVHPSSWGAYGQPCVYCGRL